MLIGIYLYHFVAADPGSDPEVAAAGLRANVFAALAAVSYAASNIMATVFEREQVRGVEGRALSSLELTFLGSIVALIVAPVIAVLLQVSVAPDSIVPFSLPPRSCSCSGPFSRGRYRFLQTPC